MKSNQIETFTTEWINGMPVLKANAADIEAIQNGYGYDTHQSFWFSCKYLHSHHGERTFLFRRLTFIPTVELSNGCRLFRTIWKSIGNFIVYLKKSEMDSKRISISSYRWFYRIHSKTQSISTCRLLSFFLYSMKLVNV